VPTVLVDAIQKRARLVAVTPVPSTLVILTEKRLTPNVECPTSNYRITRVSASSNAALGSVLDVGRWAFDVVFAT